jgi:hypothetical protein
MVRKKRPEEGQQDGEQDSDGPPPTSSLVVRIIHQQESLNRNERCSLHLACKLDFPLLWHRAVLSLSRKDAFAVTLPALRVKTPDEH